MVEKIKYYYYKYKELILYLFFGGMTTLVNIAAFWICDSLLHLGTIPSTVAAWIASVLFAYITNRIWVFQSKASSSKEIAAEIFLFFGCRALSGAMDVGIMWLCVDMLHYNSMLIKILSNIVVVILNYLFSKILIFRKNSDKK